jgi:hypothetical protein
MIQFARTRGRGAARKKPRRPEPAALPYCRISNAFSKKPGFADRKGASFPAKTSAMIPVDMQTRAQTR